MAGSAAAPGLVRTWEEAERGIAPRAGLSDVPPHALWFLALWHLLRVRTWAWRGSGNEAEGEQGVGTRAVSAAVRGAVCVAGREAEAAHGAEDDSGGTLTGKEDGFVSAPDEVAVGGPYGGKVQWFVGRGVESPIDCSG